jgi:glucose-6-phosphate isomerase
VKETSLQELDATVARIWKRDPTLWMPPGRDSEAVAKAIGNRLGWLDAPDGMRTHVERVKQLAAAARSEGIRDVYLLGMGGSSLCAEVMRTSVAARGADQDGRPHLHVLDTTDEQALTSASARLMPERTWFLVSSKSGGTVEVVSMERYFWSVMTGVLGGQTGRHFVAITDPNTALDSLSRERGYRETFLNPPDIGGRFSALSLFGLVPAALLGMDIEHLLHTASDMAAGCRQETGPLNPGLALGAFMARECRHGRDKLTVLLPPSLRMLGLWIEQLVAESTGKHGTGVLPIVDEDPQAATAYGNDRAFVSLETEKEKLDVDFAGLEAAGHPLMRLTLRSDALGAEFFRWEFATAVAGAALQINPFDEPNVQEAKDRTRALLAQVAHTAALPDAPPAERESLAALRGLIAQLAPPQYLGVLLYLPVESDTLEAIEELRSAVRDRSSVATTLGVGPRYLHSTGQYHKGGPDTGTFLVITGEDATRTPVPDAPYTFSVLKRAQAVGDLQALQAHGRKTARLHLMTTAGRGDALRRVFAEALR